MISTNEEYSLLLIPEDRCWAAFECASTLKGKKLYFKGLVRYWRLHRSKTDVLNVLLGISNIELFDAERERPASPYLTKLMHWKHPQQMRAMMMSKSQFSKNAQYYGNMVEQQLLHSFIKGVAVYLAKFSLSSIKKTIPSADLFYEESKYWIEVSLLPDLFYIWAYGTDNCVFSSALWEMLSIEQQHIKMIRPFKNLLTLVAPEMTSRQFYQKAKSIAF